MYKLLDLENFDGVLRVEDNAQISNPCNGWSRDWQAYQDWLAAGGVPEAADQSPEVVEETKEQVLARAAAMMAEVQALIAGVK